MSQPSFLQRLFGRGDSAVVQTASANPPATQTKAPVVVIERKANLLPRGAYAQDVYEFFSPDGGRTMYDLNRLTALAFAAYWYCAVRWKSMKLSEAPLMVVEEDQDTGSEEWLSDHELAPLLEMPAQDYDMGELIERTSRYLDNTGECLWAIDFNNLGQPARITPFKRGEFTIEKTPGRLYGLFKITAVAGGTPIYKTAEQVCYFRDLQGDDWMHGGVSRLDVAMNWLRLGESARQTVRDLLANSVWPSGVAIPDKDWNPSQDELDFYIQQLSAYGDPGNKGQPFAMIGGGSFVQLAAKIRELMPDEVLNRVESVVAAISGVPAIVLQFQVGMENSPWSQMGEARAMAYDDTIQPGWRKLERVMTRQLLRPMDEDVSHFIRFDRSQIASLQEDQAEAVTIATMMGRAATLNERRVRMGLEPATEEQDPEGKADDIPELTDALALSLMTPGGNLPTGEDEEDEDEEADDEEEGDDTDSDEDPPKDKTKTKRFKRALQRKRQLAGIQASLRTETQAVWEATVKRLLAEDHDTVLEIVSAYLPEDTGQKSAHIKASSTQRVMTAVNDYLKTRSASRWSKTVTPMLTQAAERSAAVVAADIGVNFRLLHPNLVKFAQKESAALVSSVTKTTAETIRDIVAGGLEEGRSVRDISNLIRDCTAFTKERADLIARTETTRAFNGAPHDAIKQVAASTGREFVKTWSSALDDRVRDEHAAMEGETVGIKDNFSNGRPYPDEPNCRCAALISEVT